MKKFSKIVLLLLLLTVSVFAVVSCNDDKAPVVDPVSGSISVKEEPQLVYVLGEELDLSNGMLEIKNGEDVSELPLNSEGITVSGYDKNVLGEQTVTIEYGGKTTQITVTVVQRMQAIEFVTDYLVGDSFDASKGRLKITRNDGTTFTVILNNEKVTVSGFDSSSASTRTLTAKYDNGDAVYECTFDVNIHVIDSIEFHAPKKVAYDSHERGIDLSEGYLTLKGNNGSLTKNISLTEEMVSGFDLTAVTEENSPLSQRVTVTYNDKQYGYDVKLTYTDVSIFKKKAVAFAGLDWSGAEVPEYTAEQGELALELMELYLDLSKADQGYITKEESLNVARTALMYGMDSMEDEFAATNGAFEISGGDLTFTCVSYEAVEAAIVVLKDDDNDIYRVSPLLISLIEEFSEEQIVTDLYFGDFGMLEVETYEGLIDLFEHMLDVYDTVALIPENWKTEGVTKYATEIQTIYNTIISNDYRESSLGEVYYRLSAWRTNDDAFDILYTYFYELNDTDALKTLASIRLPLGLEDLASYILMALDQVDMISSYMQMDTSQFMYYYYMAVNTSEAIKMSDDVMIKELYETLPINGVMGIDQSVLFHFDTMLAYLRTMEGGFYQFSGGLLGLDAYHTLMDRYMDVVIRSLEDETYEGTEAYNQAVEEIFGLYVKLSPTQQLNFLSTLNAFYGMGIPPLAFDDSGDSAMLTCLFVDIINEYYRSKFTENSVAVYNDLVIAMEIYAQRLSYENWLEEFTTRIDGIKTAYDEQMSVEDKAAFDLYLREAYDKYAAIRERYQEPSVKTELGEWEDDFLALKEAIVNVELAYYLMENDITVYSLFFSAYEKAQSLANYILANAPQEILDAYYYEDLYYFDIETGDETLPEEGGEIDGTEGDVTTTESMAMSFEYVLNLYRVMYINYQLTLMEGGSAYDMYNQGDLRKFLEQCNDITWTYFLSDEDPATLDFDKESVLTALATFRGLSPDEKMLFIYMEGTNGLYYTSLDAFFKEAFTEQAAAVALKVLELEQMHLIYVNLEDADAFESMKTTLATLKKMYSNLSESEADKNSFADFEDAYTFYVEECERLIAEAETETQA